MILRIATAVGAALALSVAAVSGARAAYVVTFLQVGQDVVAIGGGSLDLAGLVKQRDPRCGVAEVVASIGAEITGPVSSTPFDQYVGATGPSTYGGGGSPLPSGAGSCSSAEKPMSDSRPLYAGRRPPSHQAPGGLVPEEIHAPGFDDACFLTTRLRRVHCHSSFGHAPAQGPALSFWSNAHHHAFWTQQLGVV
jgi:hypothetical protein